MKLLLLHSLIYLGRIDRIFLTKTGEFQVKYGSPAEKPDKPGNVDDALEVATINLTTISLILNMRRYSCS